MTRQERKSFEFGQKMETAGIIGLIIALLAILAMSAGCGPRGEVGGILKRKNSPVPTPNQGQDIYASSFSDLQAALSSAHRGDRVHVNRQPVPFTTAAGFIVPDGVAFIGGEGASAAPETIIDYTGSARVSMVELGDGASMENFTLTSSGDATVGIRILAGKNSVIRNNTFKTNGVQVTDAENVTIEGNLIVPSFTTGTIGSMVSSSGMIVSRSKNIVIRKNTVYGRNNTTFAPTIGIALIDNMNAVVEENIVVNGQSGLQIDDVTLTTATIQYNCVWNNGAFGFPTNFYNSNTQAVFTPTGAGNISADPLFVSAANGDLRLLPSSPCATAGKNGGPIGAREVVHVLEAKLTKTSPIGVAPKSKGTKILEFEIATGDKDVELYGFAWKIISTRNITVEIQLVEEATGGSKTLDTSQYPLNNGTWSAGLHVNSTIQANSKKVYFLTVDTSSMQVNDTLHAEIWSLDVKEGGQVRFLPMFTGNVISF